MSFLSSLFGRGAASDEVRPDAATSMAAARVLALAGSGPDWWPYAALVARELMAVHVAGAAAPAPVAPWRTGPDPRLWAISRADAQSALEGGQAVADLLAAATVPRPVLLGRYPNGFVYLDVARAPGPLAVRGAEPWAGWVRELLIAQLPAETQVLDGAAPVSGAHWPVEVNDQGTISVLGAAMAFGIKSPERLDLPIVPSRRSVLRELAAATRPPAAPEDAAAAPSNAGTRRSVAPADPPIPPSEPVSRTVPQPRAAALSSASAPRSAPKPGSAPSGAEPAPPPAPAPAAKPASKAPLRPQSVPAASASSTPAAPAKPAAPVAPAKPATTAKPAGPAAAAPAQRQLPAELYEAPAISAAAPAPAPAPASAPRSAAAPPPQRARPGAPAAAPAPPLVSEWTDVAVSSAED